MQHDEQVRLTKELIAHLDAGTNVDAGGLIPQSTSTYTDAGQAAREWREWFRGMPHCIGMSGDLAEPGAFLTTEDLGTPMLATRDTEGVFRASVNSCRPRGALRGDGGARHQAEPALHHYHQTYACKLGRPVPTIVDAVTP